MKDPKKRKRPSTSPVSSSTKVKDLLSCSFTLLEALSQRVESSQRSCCVLLSNRPEAALLELLRGWRSMNGRGKGLIIYDEGDPSQRWSKGLLQQDKRLRSLSWSSLAALSKKGPVASKLGCCIVTEPLRLSPSALASLADSLQGGGMLIFVLPKVKTWEEVRPSHHQQQQAAGPALLFERLLIRLPDCRSWLLLDSNLNVIPTSPGLQLNNHGSSISDKGGGVAGQEEEDMNLEELQESLAETPIVGKLINLAATVDQARIMLTFLEAASEKSVSGTIAATGPRGRGKSSSIGLCLAGAIAYGYSNIFLTAPSPQAAQPIFNFLLRGFDALAYVEEKDYDLIQGVTEEIGGDNDKERQQQVLLRINLFREHRQTIQYIYPTDASKLEQAEVLAIDDAASFDPEVLRALLGPYLMLVCSTVGGAEGAGPSTAFRLLDQLRSQASNSASQVAAAAAAEVKGSQTKKGERQVHEERWRKAAEAVSALGSTRSLMQISAEIPVHWASKDPLERWVTKTLGLGWEAIGLRYGTPAPWDCDLFYINGQALFSGYTMTEQLLDRLLYVYGAWDQSRDPDRLLSLVGEHDHLLVLLSPEAEEQSEKGGLPDILALVHFRLMGGGQGGEVDSGREGGEVDRPSAEIVHIATHPDVMKMGYGSRTLQLLGRYLRGEVIGPIEEEDVDGGEAGNSSNSATAISTEYAKPRLNLPPVLATLEEKGVLWGSSKGKEDDSPSKSSSNGKSKSGGKRPHNVYVKGVPTSPAWYLTLWGRAGYRPISLEEGQQQQEDGGKLPGVPTVTMALGLIDAEDLEARAHDFQARTLRLLPSEYSNLNTFTALGLVQFLPSSSSSSIKQTTLLEGGTTTEEAMEVVDINSCEIGATASNSQPITAEEQSFLFTGHDLKRLEMYSKSLVDHTMVSDLLPLLGQLFFQGRLPGLPNMPDLQSAILLGLGMQRKNLETLSVEFQLPPHQVIALFNKAVRRLSGCLQAMQEAEVEAEIAAGSLAAREAAAKEHHVSLPIRLEDEMEKGAKESLAQMKSQQEEVLRSLDVMKYAVKGTAEDWQEVLKDSKKVLGGSGGGELVQIRSKKDLSTTAPYEETRNSSAGWGSDDEGGGRGGKKRRFEGGGGKRGGGRGGRGGAGKFKGGRK